MGVVVDIFFFTVLTRSRGNLFGAGNIAVRIIFPKLRSFQFGARKGAKFGTRGKANTMEAKLAYWLFFFAILWGGGTGAVNMFI